MKRKNVQLPAPAYLCSSVTGQQMVYVRRSLREVTEGPLSPKTDVLGSPKVQSALYAAQNTIDEALFSAVQNKRIPQTIARLLAQGANINAVRDGLSPLFIAILNKDLAIAAFLITQGAAPHLRDEYGNSALHIIATRLSKKTLDIAQLLIIAGAEINAQNTLGQTPLHLHGKGGALYKQFAQLLIKHGARLDLIDIRGNEPFSLLPEKTKEELMRFALFSLFDR